MKKIYVLLICLGVFTSSLLQAQVHNNSEIPTSINDSGNAPEASAILDVNASNKGILIPRMTMATRNAIPSPAMSLMVYQTDNTPGFYFYDGTAWMPISSGAGAQLTEAQVDAFVANNGYVTTSDDADADPMNEIELPTGGNSGQVLVTDGAGNYAWADKTTDTNTQLSEVQVDAFVANNGYVTTSDDADNDPTNEIQDISGIADNATDIATNATAIAAINVPTDNSQLANGAGYVTTSDDADNDPTNEIQDISCLLYTSPSPRDS